MKKALVLMVLIAVLMPAGVASLAQGPTSQPEAVPPPRLMLNPRPSALQALRLLSPVVAASLARQLGLSDALKAQVTDLLTKAEDALRPKIEAQRKAAQEFVVAMADGATTEAALTAAAEKASKAEIVIVVERIKTLFQLRALLSEQQRSDLNKYIGDRTQSWRTEGGFQFPGNPTPLPAPAAPAGEAKPEQGAK